MSGHHALYVAVYEHKGPIIPGLTREFMRHSGILVDVGDQKFDIYHVTGTPGIGLTYGVVPRWDDPRSSTARLISMDFVAWIPSNRYAEVAEIARAAPITVSRTWNCQDWVRGVLDTMVNRGLITAAQRDEAHRKQRVAVQKPFTTETPNAAALSE